MTTFWRGTSACISSWFSDTNGVLANSTNCSNTCLVSTQLYPSYYQAKLDTNTKYSFELFLCIFTFKTWALPLPQKTADTLQYDSASHPQCICPGCLTVLLANLKLRHYRAKPTHLHRVIPTQSNKQPLFANSSEWITCLSKSSNMDIKLSMCRVQANLATHWFCVFSVSNRTNKVW